MPELFFNNFNPFFMSFDSKIQWTEATWNPWHGCKKVSEGCKFCYMYRDKERYGQNPATVMKSKTAFKAPLNWKEPKLIFTCSWSDWFIEEADAWREEAWQIIKATPQHTYQILTKRPERILSHLPADWGTGYPNVWLGVSVENQEVLGERLFNLSMVPAVVRFVSAEPLLGPLKFKIVEYYGNGLSLTTDYLRGTEKDWNANGPTYDLGTKRINKIDWVIVGGESGNENGKYTYRPCSIVWIMEITKQCAEAGVPVFVKQLGTSLSNLYSLADRHGGNWAEWPIDQIKVREMPKSYSHAIPNH